MKTLESFLKNRKPDRRSSNLKEFENEINQLYETGFKIETIQEFLKANGVKKGISQRNIYKFISKNPAATPVAASAKKPDYIKNNEIEENMKEKSENDATQKWLKRTIDKAKG
jgi:DNA-binding transcriptional MerR regulator